MTGEPLSETERARAQALYQHRRKIAWQFAGLAGLVTVLFDLRVYFALSRKHPISAWLVAGGVTATIVFVVWFFGWRLVTALRRDAEAGHKLVVRGEITRLSRDKNRYGEIVTRLMVNGVELLTREQMFDQASKGEVVGATYLPASKVVLERLSPEP